ncbi:NTP transferase domain-containing protein [Streptacidiphilus sp. EB129]|uniref:nucleotidyltransferase family protein n=1 Tax=Streptacidiphilus sp. EB129 TaxID=3156262 RepID=UPI003513071E
MSSVPGSAEPVPAAAVPAESAPAASAPAEAVSARAGSAPAGPGSAGSRAAGPVAALLLAAGGGRRLGLGPKALLPYRGRPLLEHAVAVLRAGGCGQVVVVLGAGADRVAAAADLSGCVVARNPDWESGMGSSLRVGLAAMPLAATAALVALVDTPGLSAAAVRRMLDAHRAGSGLAAAAYRGRRAHPVLIGAGYWDEAARGAVADAGARALLAARAAELTLVECGDVATPDDIDTPDAWSRWRSVP